ncbi:GPW/gp25 family protein [Azohydromonas caseinilytica]|uniref:GPW/gp25 family protein n=1 Tax=Azohydromonas caseinilytica TaxID=2728836 RepID=A0A848FG19_9BURK|nr:GPW/gp25 family protein [Azohydromonas caseinilytica]NML16831.1 GPW/gp25 family protein [Azohydromonas caseinilytica]
MSEGAPVGGRHLAFPFRIGADGRSAAPADLAEHVRGELVQLLLTAPGERPFLPGFGAGLRRLVFERNDPVAAGLAKATLSRNLSRWLGHRVVVEVLEVDATEALLSVDLRYRIVATGEVRGMRLQGGGR